MSAAKGNNRHLARELIIQALYQWQMSQTELTEIERQFQQHANLQDADQSYFKKMLYDIPKHTTELDNAFGAFCDRDVAELNLIELSVLRLATYELMHCPEIPYKVVINEAIELCKSFGSQDGYKYVNGIVDKVSQQVRTDEINDT